MRIAQKGCREVRKYEPNKKAQLLTKLGFLLDINLAVKAWTAAVPPGAGSARYALHMPIKKYLTQSARRCLEHSFGGQGLDSRSAAWRGKRPLCVLQAHKKTPSSVCAAIHPWSYVQPRIPARRSSLPKQCFAYRDVGKGREQDAEASVGYATAPRPTLACLAKKAKFTNMNPIKKPSFYRSWAFLLYINLAVKAGTAAVPPGAGGAHYACCRHIKKHPIQ